MLIVKENPKGIDVAIRKFQEKLYKALVKVWRIDDEQPEQIILYQCYGRCYRNKKDKGYIAEVYTGNNEYKEVYWNDEISAISFFGIDNIKLDVLNTADVHLLFFVNLEKLKPDTEERADEEVRLDVTNAIGAGAHGFKLSSVELWLENVLREYPGSYRDDNLKAVDMHPVHCFRLNLSLTYNPNSCL